MELLVLSLLGALLALDGTSLGQFMVSRPLVAGTLTGWILGDPALGLAVGSLLELYLLVEFPVGGARFPEGATATVVAVTAAASGPGSGAVAIGVATGLVWGQVGGMSITLMRRLNARLLPDPGTPEATAASVVRSHLTGLSLDFLRGILVTLTGLLTGRAAVAHLAAGWPLDIGRTRGVLLLGALVSLGILLRTLSGTRGRVKLFMAGAAAGLVGGWLL